MHKKSAEKYQVFLCEKCDYITCVKSNYIKHLATQKHINGTFGTKMAPKWHKKYLVKTSGKYICTLCDYNTSHASHFYKHISTRKHQLALLENTKISQDSNTSIPLHTCNTCGKQYKHKCSLYKHIKRKHQNVQSCSELLTDDTNSCSTYIAEKSAEKYQNIIMTKKEYELSLECSKLKGIIETINATPTIINNVQYNSLNVHMYLNTHYKNAMNLNDFINKLQLSYNDLSITRDKGYVYGVSNILLKNLKDISEEKRPIHYITDSNNQDIYVKDKNTWEKDKGKLDEEIIKIDKLQLKKCSHMSKDNKNSDEEFLKLVKELTNINHDKREKVKDILKKYLEIEMPK